MSTLTLAVHILGVISSRKKISHISPYSKIFIAKFLGFFVILPKTKEETDTVPNIEFHSLIFD